MIKISVVIPMFNSAKWICRTIGSVYAQFDSVHEVIVVDDGSTDDGPTLVREHFPGVILLEQENGGPGSARNHGIEAATGDWIAFIDADDFWLPSHVGELMKLIRQVPHAGLVSTHVFQLRAGQKLDSLKLKGSIKEIDYFRLGLLERHRVHTCGIAIQKAIFSEVGPFLGRVYGQDLEYWARIALRYPVAVSSARTAIYVRGTNGRGERIAKRRKQSGEVHKEIPDNAGGFGASSNTVWTALQSGDYSVSRSSLEYYLDGRVRRSFYSRLRRGDLEDISKLRGLFHRPLRGINSLIFLLMLCPSSVLSKAVRLRSRLRQWVLN